MGGGPNSPEGGITMNDTEFSATRMVGGDELILRRLPGSHWEVDRYAVAGHAR